MKMQGMQSRALLMVVGPKRAVSIYPFCEKKGCKTTKAKRCLFSTRKDSEYYREDNKELGTGKSFVKFVLSLLSSK
jgi:hypothetical protein